MVPIQGRLQTFMATVNDPDTHELLDDTIALIEMNRLRPTPGSIPILHARLSPTPRAMGSTSVYGGTYLAECFFPTGG